MKPELLRATLTLLTGSVAAHAIPLLLGPALTRLYSPEAYGQFALLWAVSTNIAVVACARYDFALPLETADEGAAELMALCARILLAVTAASAAVGALLALWGDLPLAWSLPLAVAAGGAMQWLTMWATRSQLFGLLALARLLQQGGGAIVQLLLGLLKMGPMGLMLGSAATALGAACLLARPAPAGGWAALWRMPRQALTDAARRHSDFPLLNTPHAFLGALQDTLTLVLVATLTGDASAGVWALALRYLKAPATLVGGALSQTLYPRLLRAPGDGEARAIVRRAMLGLAAIALPLAAVLLLAGPQAFTLAFGDQWTQTGELARAMAPYIALHFVASPLAVVTMAWKAQAWALRLALAGQCLFFAGLVPGLYLGGLAGAGWGISASMLVYFGYYFWALANWKDIPHESAA
ncbi:lipopolysaccharide biosynthesis protein [Acidovorax sp. NB1]|uniref:lipopolysaccharide biosynthesis protein n=1 Tax=Acidovorax sp. NB1 TaxID=1943571 RepID=UPI0010F78CCB|nr:oligosaccharide flippase family protein [Acidovorax sp. NB1]